MESVVERDRKSCWELMRKACAVPCVSSFQEFPYFSFSLCLEHKKYFVSCVKEGKQNKTQLKEYTRITIGFVYAFKNKVKK